MDELTRLRNEAIKKEKNILNNAQDILEGMGL
jgi:hypothetical protein